MMLRRLTALTAMIALLVSFSPEAGAAFWNKKKKQTPVKTEKPAPAKKTTPFAKFKKDVAEYKDGGFATIYRTKKDKIFLGLPVKYLGRKMLVAGTVTSTSDPSSIKIGYKYGNPVYFQVDRKDSLVVLSVADQGAVADSAYSKAYQRNYVPRIIKMLPLTYSADSSSVIFEVTSFVTEAFPKDKDFRVNKGSGEGKTTWYGEMKSNANSVSIILNNNVEFFRNVLFASIVTGHGTVGATVSFLLLPEKPMRPRIQDIRMGVFSTSGVNRNNKYILSGDKDGFSSFKMANRWRLELTDTAAWLAGKKVEVKTPIVWYVDDSFPENWKPAVRKGILAWNDAFERIGLLNVMQVKDFPSKEEDPEFDPDNLAYNCIRYVPNAVMNAQGPSWVDPTTGEILNASVMIHNDVIRLVNNWRYVLTAQVDEKVRAVKMPQDIIDESLIYVVSHEVGHTLGLMHNMASSHALPTEKLRDPEFTAKYGTTPSIMDYARFNYVAQPGDKGVKLTPPSLGVYDYYVIDWLYRPVPQAKDMFEEAKIAGRTIDEHEDDPLYRYGAQQIPGSSSYGSYDPYARSEDLGDDPVKSSNYGIANLKYILANTNTWLADQDPDYTHRKELYSQIASQYLRYMNHVLAQVGGIELYFPGPKSKHLPAEPVSRQTQRAALKWTANELRHMGWLADRSLTSHFNLSSPVVNTVALNVASNFVDEIPDRVMLCSSLSEDPYTLKQYFDDLYNEVFAPAGKLSSEMKTVQREIVSKSVKPIKKAQSASLAEDELGENRSPYQAKITAQSYDETKSYYGYFVSRVQALAKARRNSAAPEDRAHYDYLYRLTTAADPE